MQPLFLILSKHSQCCDTNQVYLNQRQRPQPLTYYSPKQVLPKLHGSLERKQEDLHIQKKAIGAPGAGNSGALALQ